MSNLRTRRDLLRVFGASAVASPFAASLLAQGRCQNGYNTPGCPMTQEVATAPIKPLFAPTGWKTAALEHISFQVPDYRKEAAFYVALLGWKLRSDDGKQAVLDIGDWGSAIFKAAPPEQTSVLVDGFGFAIEPWNAQTVEAELLQARSRSGGRQRRQRIRELPRQGIRTGSTYRSGTATVW